MDFKVADKAGEWLLNGGRFPFVDPDSGTRFEPGMKTKAKVTEWAKAQMEAGWLKATSDPFAEEEPKQEEPKKDEPKKDEKKA